MDNRRKKIVFLGILLAGCVLTSFIADWAGSGALPAWIASGSRNVERADERAVAQNGDGKYAKQGGSTGGTLSGKQNTRGAKMLIYVSGAVVEPGMYELAPGARAQSAVEAAGGLRPDADTSRVNLAKKLKDGMQVHVPAQKSAQRSNNKSAAAKNHTYASAGKVAALGEKGVYDENWISKNQNAGVAQNRVRSSRKVNINTADVAELQSLPGIGPAMAQRIIAERAQRKFFSVDDLRRVKGIGASKLEQLRAYVEVR